MGTELVGYLQETVGDWVARALFETGFANKSTSLHKNDALGPNGAYMTAAVKCAPPQNKPLHLKN